MVTSEDRVRGVREAMLPGPLSVGDQRTLQALVDSLAWHACTPAYAAQVGPHEYVVRHKTCTEEQWTMLQEAIRRYGRRERYLVTGNTFTYLVLGEHRYWTAPGWEVINRARQKDVADKYGPPSPSEDERPRTRTLKLQLHGDQVIRVDTGEVFDVVAVAARLPWRLQGGSRKLETYNPVTDMPIHWYVVMGKCDYDDWDVLAFAVANHPGSYRAYFRGYRSPMRYWEPGDGYRYWQTRGGDTLLLNRCTLDSVEPPRRVDFGAVPFTAEEWDAPIWLPRGTGWTEEMRLKHPEHAPPRESGE